MRDSQALLPFYEAVCNWTASDHDMGAYVDFDMSTASGDRVAGLCQAKGANAALPPVWLMYVAVPSLKDALGKVEGLGGTVIMQPTGAFAVIADPAGTHLALWEQPVEAPQDAPQSESRDP
ncbi:MAG: VOC family protein [Pseudomonadota bacterium]